MRSSWIALAAFAGVASADGPSAAAEHGRYVATAANCISCHTREGGPDYAGGRPLATPLGRIYATNITPDRETGIGSWSAADLKRALREGVAADMAYRGNMKKRLSRANAAGAKYALIIGDDELDRGEAQLKDLATGEQKSVSLDLIGEAIRS
jgi:mono/diheme cytochrome c family protein